jgi:hypothetical protein
MSGRVAEVVDECLIAMMCEKCQIRKESLRQFYALSIQGQENGIDEIFVTSFQFFGNHDLVFVGHRNQPFVEGAIMDDR